MRQSPSATARSYPSPRSSTDPSARSAARAGPTSRSPLSRAARAARSLATPRDGNRCPADPLLPSPAHSRRPRLAIHGRRPGCGCAAGSGVSSLCRRRGSITPRPPTSSSSDRSPRSHTDGRGAGPPDLKLYRSQVTSYRGCGWRGGPNWKAMWRPGLLLILFDNRRHRWSRFIGGVKAR